MAAVSSVRYEPWGLGCWGLLAEPAAEPVTESELSWIWAGQRYPAGALSLVDGRALRVVNPGRPGGGAGPDYLDAVLEIDGETVRGDVELHVRSSWFRAHGHDTDPAYDGVALHVVFRADEGARTRLSNGAGVPVAAFAPWLEGRAHEIAGWLASEAFWREPCRDAAARLGEDGVRQRLREAGRQRFEAKVAAMRASVAEAGPDEALWRAMFDQMGVGGDREGFRRLARALPASLAGSFVGECTQDEAPARLGGALLYCAGLTSSAGPASTGSGQALTVGRPGGAVAGSTAGEQGALEPALVPGGSELARIGPGLPGAGRGGAVAGSTAGEQGALEPALVPGGSELVRMRPGLASSGRPANRPERRLAGLAALFARAQGDLPGFAERSVGVAKSVSALVAAWQVAGARGGPALIGPDRARELVLNVALPFAAGGPEGEQALSMLEALGASPAYGRTAFLENHLRQDSARRPVRGALEQQGLLAFVEQWCSRDGCGRCPLS